MKSYMKAAVLETNGQPFQVKEIGLSEPKHGQVLVRVIASGINPLDLKIHEGLAGHAHHPVPAVLGIDMSGVVEAVGGGVKGFKEGDAVYGMVGGVGGNQGTLAEYVIADADLLSHKPEKLTFTQAAVLPLAVITAWEGLVDQLKVQKGQHLLVLGGAGGVGSVIIQLALSFGAKVSATGKPESKHLIESLGATYIDYQESVDTYVNRITNGVGFDLVYDTLGGASLDNAFKAVKRLGHVTTALGWGNHLLAPLSFKAASFSGVFTLYPLLSGQNRKHHGEILNDFAKLVDAESLVSPHLTPTQYSFDRVNDAYQDIKSGKIKGKVVIEIVS